MLKFNLFRKETNRNQYLNYNSYHPEQHKNSVISSLIYRSLRICDQEDIKHEEHIIEAALIKNNYPKFKVSRESYKLKGKLNSNNRNSNNNDQNCKFFSAPYIKGCSEKAGRIFKKFGIKLAHKPTKTLRSELCNNKDKIETQNRAGVIYKLKCNDCDANYIGETGRQIKERMQEHKKDIETKKPCSKVAMHVENTGHSFNFQNISVLDSCESTRVRKQLEGVYTYIHKDTINRAITLNDSYISVLNNIN